MFKIGEKSHLWQNDETFFCSNLYRSVEFCRSLQSQTITITYSKLTAITKNTPTNYVAEILQKQLFISTSTNPDGCHMSNFYRPKRSQHGKRFFKVQQSLLENSSEMNKLPCFTKTAFSPVTKFFVMGTNFPSQDFWVMESFNWLTLGQLKYSMK